MPPAGTADRIAGVLSVPRSVHRRTVPDLARKAWRMVEERVSTRGRPAVAIGERVLTPTIARLNRSAEIAAPAAKR
jgi:hypothetical protein